MMTLCEILKLELNILIFETIILWTFAEIRFLQMAAQRENSIIHKAVIIFKRITSNIHSHHHL